MQQKPSEAAADQHGNAKGNGVTFCPQLNHPSFVELKSTEKHWNGSLEWQTRGEAHRANTEQTHTRPTEHTWISNDSNLPLVRPGVLQTPPDKTQVYSQKLTLLQALPVCCWRKAGHWGKNQPRSQGFGLYLFVQLTPGAAPSTLLAKTPTRPKRGITQKGSPKLSNKGPAPHGRSRALI